MEKKRLAEKLHIKKKPSSFQVMGFILALCFVCGFLLAVTSYALSNKQKQAREFDQSKQMLIAAGILNHRESYGINAIETIATLRIRPLLTDIQGDIFSFEEKNINLENYLSKNKKTGYAASSLKLFYAILPDEKSSATITAQDLAKDLSKASIFVIPVSGFGLWGPIYGYIALDKDGDTVIGTTWYEHAETPGLGANITESWWQNLFHHKVIFQQMADGKTDFATAPMGIIVVKGKVKDVFGSSPKGNSAVDGMSGATLTGDGVTAAYRTSLTPYRKMLLKLHNLKETKK